MTTRFLVAAAAAFALSTSAQAAYITNGDFEQTPGADASTTTFPGWTKSANGAAVVHDGLSGDYAAKLVLASNGRLSQALSEPLSTWVIEFDLALTDPGGDVTSSGRSLQLNVTHTNPNDSTGNINLIIGDQGGAGVGDVRTYHGSAFADTLQDLVTFSVDSNGDGTLSAEERKVNHLRIAGDYSTATPSYVITLTNADGQVVSSSAVARWQGAAAAEGATIKTLSFETGSFSPGSFSVIDNVSVVVPEPAAAGLLGAMGVLALRRRRSA